VATAAADTQIKYQAILHKYDILHALGDRNLEFTVDSSWVKEATASIPPLGMKTPPFALNTLLEVVAAGMGLVAFIVDKVVVVRVVAAPSWADPLLEAG